MKRTGKQWFFIVAILIFVLTYCSFFGVTNYYGDKVLEYVKGADDIRWGIDIKGGVEGVFSPSGIDPEKVTKDQLDAAETVIKNRLIGQGITDYETFVDSANTQIVVRFPWSSNQEDYNATSEINKLGDTAIITFREGNQDVNGAIVLQGAKDIDSANVVYDQSTGEPQVQLVLTNEGKTKFASATARLKGDTISIFRDDVCISAPTVNDTISDGYAIISGNFDVDTATELASEINAGTLPFALSVDDSKIQVVSATLGEEALNVMIIAGVIAFAVICLLLLFRYRLPGAVACIALVGQVGGMIACITKFFPGTDSFTMTIPGLAGIILAIGMGVDANVITMERIREELRKGKTITGAISAGSKNSIAAIIDGNITNVIVAVVLMGAFGPSDNIFAKLFSWVFGFFGASVTGAIYSFGYTLLIGVVLNFIFAVFASQIMLKALSGFKCLRKNWLYGIKENTKEAKSFKFVSNLKKFGTISLAVIAVGVILTAVFGPVLDIQFKGGTKLTYSYTGEISLDDASKALKSDASRVVYKYTGDLDQKAADTAFTKAFGDDFAAVKLDEGVATAFVKTALEEKTISTATKTIQGELKDNSITNNSDETLVYTKDMLGKNFNVTASSDFSGTAQKLVVSLTDNVSAKTADASVVALQTAFADKDVESGEINSVSASVGKRFFVKALVAVLIASILVVIYVGFRFRRIGGISAGISALIALVHDIAIAFIVCIVFRLSIDANFIAVVLTLLGYSLNNTIIIFDRIRENRRIYGTKLSLAEAVDKSNNETLTRTVITTITTLAAIVVIIIVSEIMGLTSLRTFAIPLSAGLIFGAYSSICLAPTIWVKWKEKQMAKAASAPKSKKK